MENNIYVNTKKQLFPAAEDLYGLFFEDINRAGDGGLYPEMIRNRSFEDSLTPDGCTVDEKKMVYINKAGWPGAFNHGEGMDDWAEAVPYTPVPGWYVKNAQMELDTKETLHVNRKASLKVDYQPGGILYNIGYAGIPLKKGESYLLCLFVKSDTSFRMKAFLQGEQGEIFGSAILPVESQPGQQPDCQQPDCQQQDFQRQDFQHQDTQHQDFQHQDTQQQNFQRQDYQQQNFQRQNTQQQNFQHQDTQHQDFQHQNFQWQDTQHQNFQHQDFQQQDTQHQDFQHQDTQQQNFQRQNTQPICAARNGKLEQEGNVRKHPIGKGGWQKIEVELIANEETTCQEDFRGKIGFQADTACSVLFGFTSLMPKETFMGHGLRTDLCLMLKNMHPRFLRFPGGCIVEGMTQETAMRFSHTIGPVWERPCHNLMWHYRTTNGLGFHEYLQLCEDLQVEAMYVCNCGMSCQARRGEAHDEEGTKEMLLEALHALEYALGDTSTKYGAMRAAAGHPQPFRLKYVEIGNENWGKEYDKRYEIFYRELKKQYPDILYISNSHTETAGLPTEYVDEHYYSTPEYFMENDGRFDNYSRKGPKIFLGEYAVNGGNTIASMECALAEAVFLTGVEKNQDIVTLSAYAPLFQNADYTAWKPNLIVFDNHQVYGIPSYHVISLFGKHRGKYVVETKLEVPCRPPFYKGVPGVMCEKPGMEIKNPKINGESTNISRVIYGKARQTEEGAYRMERGGNPHPFTGKSKEWNEAFEQFIRGGRQQDERDTMWVTFGQEDMEEYVFEVDLKFEPDNSVTLSSWNFHPDTDAGCNEPKDYDWNAASVRNQIWQIQDGKGVTEKKGFLDFGKPEPEKTPLQIDYSVFNTYKIAANHYGYQCYINDIPVQEKKHILHPLVYAVSSVEDDKVIIKVINTADTELPVTIYLDCDICEDVQVETVAAPLSSVNSFAHRENVSIKTSACKGEKDTILFPAKPYSVNVLCAKIQYQ